MAASSDTATQDQILQFLTTEHFTLQTAKATTVAEANGRAGLFLSTVSSAVVALAFIGQVSGMGRGFFVFGLVLFPPLLYLGFVTFERAIQTAIENMIHTRGINRIRHYYVELAPEIRRYFIHSTHDDVTGALKGMGIPSSSNWQHFVTNAGTVAVINSTLAGAFAGMLVRFLTPLNLYGVIGTGIAVVAAAAVAHHRYQMRRYAESEKGLETLFPSEPN